MAEGKGFGFFVRYKRLLMKNRFKMPAEAWLLVSTIIALAAALAAFLTIHTFALPVSELLAVVTFLVVVDLLLGYPYMLAVRKINAIEAALPDALKQMADTLKAGGTYEFAFREIATAEYGPLSEEMENVLRKMEEGENLENSLKAFSDNVESRLVQRTIAVIVDSIKAGAGLADILDEIADDVRAMHRIDKERKSTTMLQVIFIVAAGSMVAPAILGFISTVLHMFMEIAQTTGMGEAERLAAASANSFILTMMQLYLMIEVVASGAMISLTRDGRISKSLIYIPPLLLVAFACYYTASFVSGTMIGGIA